MQQPAPAPALALARIDDRRSMPPLRCDVVTIASDQRSGTTELAADLSARLKALDLGEYFNPWGGQIRLPRACAATAMLRMSARAADPLATVRRTRDACGRARAIVRVFPIQTFYTMTSPNQTVYEMIAGPTCVVILERNPLDRACSYLRVMATRDWLSRREAHPNCSKVPPAKREWAKRFVANHGVWFSTVRSLVRSAGPTKLVREVRFEELETRGIVDGRAPVRNATIDAIATWIVRGS
jgi:hypothetical protein